MGVVRARITLRPACRHHGERGDDEADARAGDWRGLQVGTGEDGGNSTRGFRTAGAHLRHVWACDASLYSAHTYADASRQSLLVGDAGAFIDPLSSFGVKKALASAWIAAVVVHTSLRDSGRKQIGIRFLFILGAPGLRHVT